jgi:plastocyanin
MTRRTLLAAGVSILALAACLSERATGVRATTGDCGVQLPAEAFGATVVVIRDFAFTPAQVRVRPGAKVTWVNCGAAGSDAHTSTADAGAWDSPLLPPGATFTRQFPASGTFAYHCEPHPSMRGSVVVE